MTPTIGRTVHYFPDDERRRNVGPPLPPRGPWPAIITFVHERERGREGEEIGPWVVSLTAFPPGTRMPHVRGDDALIARADYVPLAGMYDLEDLIQHPLWRGCWNWLPYLTLDL